MPFYYAICHLYNIEFRCTVNRIHVIYMIKMQIIFVITLYTQCIHILSAHTHTNTHIYKISYKLSSLVPSDCIYVQHMQNHDSRNKFLIIHTNLPKLQSKDQASFKTKQYFNPNSLQKP